MANVVRGTTIHIQRTDKQEPKIIDVAAWLAYRKIDSVVEEDPVSFIGDPVIATLPETEEGATTYGFDGVLEVGTDLTAGQTLAWVFVPDETEADLAESLTWETAAYDVVDPTKTASAGRFTMSNFTIGLQ